MSLTLAPKPVDRESAALVAAFLASRPVTQVPRGRHGKVVVIRPIRDN